MRFQQHVLFVHGQECSHDHDEKIMQADIVIVSKTAGRAECSEIVRT